MCKVGDIIVVKNKSFIIADIEEDNLVCIDYNDFIKFEDLKDIKLYFIKDYDFIFGSLNSEALLNLIHLVYQRKDSE